MTSTWKLCSNEQEQNFQIIDEQGLPVCTMFTRHSSLTLNWNLKRVSGASLWYSIATSKESVRAQMIAHTPDLLILVQRLTVALPEEFPSLISEAKKLVHAVTGEIHGPTDSA